MTNRALTDKTYRNKVTQIRHKFFNVVGAYCKICGTNKHLKCHRIDYTQHMPFEDMSMKRLAQEDPKNYARLCFQCHYGVHWLHNNFGLSWQNILLLQSTNPRMGE